VPCPSAKRKAHSGKKTPKGGHASSRELYIRGGEASEEGKLKNPKRKGDHKERRNFGQRREDGKDDGGKKCRAPTYSGAYLKQRGCSEGE